MSKKYLGIGYYELLITVALVSIVAVVAVPFYKNQQVRAKISEGILTAEPVMETVTKHYYLRGEWPKDNHDVGLPDPESYKTENVEKIQIRKSNDKTTVTIVFNIPDLGDKNTIVFTPPAVTVFRIHKWTCINSTIVEKYLPKTCRA